MPTGGEYQAYGLGAGIQWDPVDIAPNTNEASVDSEVLHEQVDPRSDADDNLIGR